MAEYGNVTSHSKYGQVKSLHLFSDSGRVIGTSNCVISMGKLLRVTRPVGRQSVEIKGQGSFYGLDMLRHVIKATVFFVLKFFLRD